MEGTEAFAENERSVDAWWDPEMLHVRLANGREVITPLWWYPSLYAATPAKRNTIELMRAGVHWPDLDEDLSIRGMLSGWKYPQARAPEKAA